MGFLIGVGAVVITLIALFVLALCAISVVPFDEKPSVKAQIAGYFVAASTLVTWWHFIGSNIHIGFG